MTAPTAGPGDASAAARPFDDVFRLELDRLMRWRRDVRRFRAAPLPAGLLEELIDLACLAPSVGLSQPWRFTIVESSARRAALVEIFTACNSAALGDYDGERAALYAGLKLAGLREAPAQVTVFADHSTETGHGLGRRTMPEMIDYSVVTAVHTLWLAARARGVGLGWVSILDPEKVSAALDVPRHWRLIGHLCLGYPEIEMQTPELETSRWEARQGTGACLLRR